jgi:hypothetical protein
VGSTDLQPLAFIFLFFFPVSCFVWSIMLIAAGRVRSLPDMPWEFRLAARVVGADKTESYSPLTAPVDGFFLALVNVVPLGLLVHPYGPISWVGAVVYVVVHVLWLVRIRRALRRVNRQ